MQDDFSKYEAMKKAGNTPEDVYHEAVRNGIDPITMYRLIRSVFHLGLPEAKEVIIKAEGLAQSLDEYQDHIASELERYQAEINERLENRGDRR